MKCVSYFYLTRDVEVIDWDPPPGYAYSTVKLTFQGSFAAPVTLPANSNQIRMVIAWDWVKSQAR